MSGQQPWPLHWTKGREAIDKLIDEGRLQLVPPNRELAERYLTQAANHVRSVELPGFIENDETGAFNLLYDAARMSLAAILIVQGLRPHGKGAHAVVGEAVLAQFEPPKQVAFRAFTWMRPLRNDSEYPSAGVRIANAADVAEALPDVKEMIARATSLVAKMPPY